MHAALYQRQGVPLCVFTRWQLSAGRPSLSTWDGRRRALLEESAPDICASSIYFFETYLKHQRSSCSDILDAHND